MLVMGVEVAALAALPPPSLLLEDGVRIVQARRTFKLDGAEIESGDDPLDALRLVEQAVDRLLHGGVAFLVAFADHLVVFLDRLAAMHQRLHGFEGGVELGFHFLVERRILGLDQIVQRRALHLGAVDARVIAVIGRRDADGVAIVLVVGIVGEAILLFFRIVQQQAELHALARKFAVGERAHAGQDGGEASLRIGLDVLGGFAVRRPLLRHVLEVGDEQRRSGAQILGTTIAIAMRAILQIIVGGRAFAGTRSGAVQVLAPEQEFDGVIADRDIGLDAAGLVQRARQEFRRQMRSVDILAVDLDRLVGDDIGDVKRVFVALGAVGSIDIVDQAFVQRPGIHLAFPIINDRITKTIDFRLRIGNASLDPGGTRCLQRLVAGVGKQGVDRLVERLRRGQRVLIFGMRQFRIMLEDGSGLRSGCEGRQVGYGSRGEDRRKRGANIDLQFHIPLL
ncbi:hypothetical protein RHSP_66467 [Rhizobium freirei PRF 81]|uniref:NAD-specific glutamate dehydrogenase n=1 Tax=Rhizobium freirei PRF 81 TaxID=363754 RepID=N6V6H2_9HYPH|nr:hypothetical protein RHSP_66467 [Rhizobium freirei PRF 81]